ncbi:MAG: zinc ribbon domain-containing protein [Acidobacteria bacterium]|nr:zinc ribbon domain-containing protein [Acidobacteriota bacterium]
MKNQTSSSNNYDQTTELYHSEVLAGRPETVRARLIDAMESLGYYIIEDDPNIIGRRDAKGWGKWYSSVDVLDYGARLTVRFRSVGEGSTRVTFDYLIKHGWLTRGDVNIVVQEAKTIAALSKSPVIQKMCSACETESTDDSRFCRKCGAPLTSESSELEVLRLMAETYAAKVSVVSAAVTMAVSMIGMLAVYLLNLAGLINPKLLLVFTTIYAFLMLFTLATSLFGWNRLKRALDKKTPSRQTGRVQEFNERADPVMLASAKPFASVTEGTTNLLDKDVFAQKETERVPVSVGRDTKDLE